MILKIAFMFAFGCWLAAAGCTGVPSLGEGATTPEGCLAPKLGVIEGRFVHEALELCDGYTWNTCPAKSYLTRKYEDLRLSAVKECE